MRKFCDSLASHRFQGMRADRKECCRGAPDGASLRNFPKSSLFLFRAAVAAVCFLLAVPALSAADPASSGTGEEGRGKEMINVGRFEEALAVLRPLARGRGADANAVFLLGLAATGASQRAGLSGKAREDLLDEAIAAFHSLLVGNPGLNRVRLELARAFFLKGDDGLATDHFERVLSANPPAAVVTNVQLFLAAMRARKRWSVRVGVALAPNTNIGAESEERIIYIHGLPFRRDREDLVSSGVGIFAWAGGEYQYPLGGRLRLRVGADVLRHEYRGGKFDRMTAAAHAGPRWLIGAGTEASLLGVVRRHWSGNGAGSRDGGLRVEVWRRLTRRVQINAWVSHVERRYGELGNLDGPVTDFALGGNFVMTPSVRLDGALGWSRERPEQLRLRNTGRWVRAGVAVALPRGFTAGWDGTLRWTNYEGDWFPFTAGGEARDDMTRSLRVNLYHRGFTLRGFSPQISLVREFRASNAQLQDYRSTFGELRFVRLF